MKTVLEQISSQALLLNKDYYNEEQHRMQWLGTAPCTEEELQLTEQRLGISLPADYREFLKITNGFSYATGVDPSFCPAARIDYLKNTDPELIDIWIRANSEVGKKMKTAIQVGGFEEEQYFLLIPPSASNKNWEYWHFASWSPGETVYTSLSVYFENVLQSIPMLQKK